MTSTTISSARAAALAGSLILLTSLFSTGCATVGSVMEVAGTLSGEKSLKAAGSSFKRVAEVEDFSEEEKVYTGRSVAANLLGSNSLSAKLDLEKYVNQVGQTVALASGKEGLPNGWNFILIKGADPDAFAAPGGIIIVSEGLVLLCQDEDELAGVLAHEVAHIAIDHPMQAISAANKKSALVSLAQYGLEKSQEGKDGGKTAAAQFGAVLKDVGEAVSHGYDRDKEKEADKEAVRILTDLGYDPRGLKRVLSRLKKGGHSHGDPAERARLVEDACYQAEPVPKLLAARTERFKKALGD